MQEEILQLISEQFNIPIDQLSKDTNLMDDLNADSIEFVELIMNIEEALDIEVDDEDLEGLETIGDVLDALEDYEY